MNPPQCLFCGPTAWDSTPMAKGRPCPLGGHMHLDIAVGLRFDGTTNGANEE